MSNKGRRPNQKELQLWQIVKKTISPLREGEETLMDEFMDDTSLNSSQPPKSVQPKKENKALNKSQPDPDSDSIVGAQDNLLDRKKLNQLRKGKLPIEGMLDMHGMTQDQAHTALKGFVMQAFHNRKRCLLVITGKGSRSENGGVLKARLPDWLSVNPMNEIVLRHEPAVQKHGGSGAFYLYLKRQRDRS